jgi:hypothetical protein
MKSWRTTVAGIITAIGVGFSQSNDPTLQLIGKILIVVGPVIFGLVAKDSSVTGGSIPQASPPGVALKSDALGVIAAVDALKKAGPITINESVAKTNAEVIVAAPPVPPGEVNLCK